MVKLITMFQYGDCGSPHAGSSVSLVPFLNLLKWLKEINLLKITFDSN